MTRQTSSNRYNHSSPGKEAGARRVGKSALSELVFGDVDGNKESMTGTHSSYCTEAIESRPNDKQRLSLRALMRGAEHLFRPL